MKEAIKIILIILLMIGLCTLTVFGLYTLVVTTNQKRYNETPLMSEIEEDSKIYILDNWCKSGVELEFITQELIGENTLVYYFKVMEPKDFYAFGTRTYYVKAVYKFKDNILSPYKSWKFDVVWTSNYEEIQTVLEVEENVD